MTRSIFALFLIFTIFAFTLFSCQNNHESIENLETSIANSQNLSTENENPTTEQSDAFENSIAYDFNESSFPLFAANESEDIYLYGVNPYGMILYQDGKGTYFEWPGLTPRKILPEMSYLDYDSDGKKDLAVILYVGSGTQWSIMDLHILNVDGLGDSVRSKPTYTDNVLFSGNVHSWMTAKLAAVKSEDKKTIVVDFNGKNYVIPADSDESISGDFKGVGFGDIVNFHFDDTKIKAKISVGVLYERFATMQIFGDIEADVKFDGKNFVLENYTLNLDKYL